MFIVYDLIFLIFAAVYLPSYFLRGKLNRGFFRRLGLLPARLSLDRPIWIHAVSVGEVVSIKGLVTRLRQEYPGKKIVISTVTTTGNKIASGLIQEGDFLTYLPLDFSFIIQLVLRKINPCMFIIAETEIWPNLITGLIRLKIPVITVNGRISDSSYSGYRLIKFLIRPILKMINLYCVQTELDQRRLVDLGVDGHKIQVTGNVKFDIHLAAEENAPSLAYRDKLWLKPLDKLWVCGSTHSQEEELIFIAYKKLLPVFPGLKLLVAPRHPERSRRIASLAVHNGLLPVFISSLSASCPSCINKPVFILDIIGELFNYYSAADVVLVGGSMVKKGGHNILEPASLKKPVIFGPHMFNFRDISELFLADQAALLAADSQELTAQVNKILSNDLLAKELGRRSSALIIKHRGATEKNVQIIKQFIKKE